MLATNPAASALSLSGSARIPGHAAGTFGGPGELGGPVGGLAWAPDGTAYTLDGARVLYRWNVRTGQPLSRQEVRAPATLPDAARGHGPRLRLGGYRADGRLRGPFIRAEGYKGEQPYQTAFTLLENGRRILGDVCQSSRIQPAGCSGRHAARVERMQAGRAVVQAGDRQGQPTRVTLPAGQVVALEPSLDGQFVAVLRLVQNTAGYDPNAQLWLDLIDLKGAQPEVRSRQLPGRAQTADSLPEVHWAGKGRVLTATSELNTETGGSTPHALRLWDLGSPQPLWTVNATQNLHSAVPSPDGRFFLTVRGGSVPEVHRVSDGRFVRALGAAVTAFTPLKGQRALVALDTGSGQSELRVLSPEGQGNRLGGVREGGVVQLAADANERHFVAGRPRSVDLLDRAGRTLHRWVVSSAPEELAFTADQRVVFARLIDHSPVGLWKGMAWNVRTGTPLPLPAATRPLRADLWVQEQRQNSARGFPFVRLRGLTPAGKVLWQEPWRQDWSAWFQPSPDGRSLLRMITRPIAGASEQRGAGLYRLDPGNGTASPGVTLRPALTGPYRGLRPLAFAPDRRHVLLGEGEGDGCGAEFHGLRLADLHTRTEVRLPGGLTSGLRRSTGCGYPVPFPEAAFTPGTHGALGLLVRDGNSLNWWLGKPRDTARTLPR
ncbi:hypothetical protein DEDE109153_14455 [Deinococcus deserti]|nr:hypothetical protein [Deinococcus deserti]